MKKIILLLMLPLVALSCKEKPVVDHGAIAGKAAVQYYGYLLRHDYTAFVDGINYPNPIPKDYREALEKNAAMFVHDQDSLRQGIKAVHLSKADIMPGDTAAAAIYLTLSYGDKSSEEILVPMVCRKGVWYMK